MNREFKTLIVIPARINSKRLPNKILEHIGDEPMIKRVLDQCNKKFKKKQIIICTDSSKIEKLSKDWGYKAFFTSNKCRSGTHRISTVLRDIICYLWGKRNIDESEYKKLLIQSLIINVQGDQPFLDPKILIDIEKSFLKNTQEKTIVTPIYNLQSESIHNPNIVKVVVNKFNEAIYFSRAPIPYNRDEKINDWGKKNNYWGHIGIYGYRGDILSCWETLPNSKLEKIESLEQLRFIENGIKINTIITKNDSFSIDTYEQLEKGRIIWNNIINEEKREIKS